MEVGPERLKEVKSRNVCACAYTINNIADGGQGFTLSFHKLNIMNFNIHEVQRLSIFTYQSLI